jgi:hypothetical protein
LPILSSTSSPRSHLSPPPSLQVSSDPRSATPVPPLAPWTSSPSSATSSPSVSGRSFAAVVAFGTRHPMAGQRPTGMAGFSGQVPHLRPPASGQPLQPPLVPNPVRPPPQASGGGQYAPGQQLLAQFGAGQSAVLPLQPPSCQPGP